MQRERTTPDGQGPTRSVTTEWIMSQPEFEMGVLDARANRPVCRSYERWDIDPQWNYERGRAWATLVPRKVALKRNGKVTREAAQWFERLTDIL